MKKVIKRFKYFLPLIIIFVLVIIFFPSSLFANFTEVKFTTNVYKETTGSALSGATYDFILDIYRDGEYIGTYTWTDYPAGGPYTVYTRTGATGSSFRFIVHEVEKTIVATYSGVSLTSMPPTNITTKITTSPEFYWVATEDSSQNVYFRNVVPEKKAVVEPIPEPAPWVRDKEMTCYQVWINGDNNFEFVFWWEYANNNHVQIFDMAGNLVFETDMEKGNARFEADLPDGMYTVKTFHDGFETPIQEFLIGKP